MRDDMTVTLHKGDLPASFKAAGTVAIDTETLGLNPLRDPLCLLQLSNGDGNAHLVQFDRTTYDAPNVTKLLADNSIRKLFHFARFDIATLRHHLGVMPEPLYCTKIASRLARTYTDRHGLKDLCKELLNLDISKQQQSSDWAATELSKQQQDYAASDVLYLHELKERLDMMLEREGRTQLAAACFDFLGTRAQLDLAGWPDDIFAH